MRYIIPVSGKDSCATAIVQMTRQPELDYELFFNDVGAELPETYDWLDRVEKVLSKPITRVGKSLEAIIRHEGILPSPRARFCTRLAKIEPMEEYIGDEESTIYMGIRADENRQEYGGTKPNIRTVYPLRELNIGLEAVYQILDKRALRPFTFFWKRLHDLVADRWDKRNKDGFGILSSWKELELKLPRWVFDQLFAWRTRSNCSFCFFQRKYEWVGLLEHYPKLFDQAEKIENEVGCIHNEGYDEPRKYTWISDCPLPKIRQEKEWIVGRRAVKITKLVTGRKLAKDPIDELSLTSCGLFCGK